MKFLITGGMGVNGAVAARLMVRDGLASAVDGQPRRLHVDRRHQESSRLSSPAIFAIRRPWRKLSTITKLLISLISRR